MNIAREANISGKPIGDKPQVRPVRMVRWFIIVAAVMSALIGALARTCGAGQMQLKCRIWSLTDFASSR